MNKIFALLLTMSAISASGQMVSTAYVRVSPERLPEGFPIPTVPSMTFPKKHTLTIDLPASLDNANDSLAVVAIKNATLDSIVTNYLVQDFRIDTSLASTGQILITDIERTFDLVDPQDDPAGQYVVANPVFRVSVTFRWRKNP